MYKLNLFVTSDSRTFDVLKENLNPSKAKVVVVGAALGGPAFENVYAFNCNEEDFKYLERCNLTLPPGKRYKNL